ncbi:polysaccharide biosynthesis protein [Agreia sp. VKM Ac-1783]|uniref:polysaccharide biosynthesis protein n=1 Tax=Agreia sp. VKM Ac-1783 TaxID=1938889 RepID=UPI000A2AAE4E|nr:polysaccharide biosynthesis protein [Agreia sp. VKM Ac-1783]SMQ60628.1 Membrane protein involved in the export of O-antigen and teichoic acid [Agreia sp. VKM Ac-1783]
MKTVLLRLTGFAALPLLSLVIPLVLLPLVSSVVGGAGVSSIVSGQSIGTFAATVLMWGWNVEGPVAVARSTSASERGAIYAASIRTRLLLVVPVVPIVVIVAALVAVPEYRLESIWMALASATAGMSPAWFCIGLGRPKLLALYDTLPRFVATVVAAPILLLSQQVWTYTLILAVATTVAIWSFQRRFSAGEPWLPRPVRGTLRQLRAQRHTAGINAAGSAYAFTPAPIATVTLSPGASGSLSSADTLYRFGIFTVIALGNAFQSWVIEPGVSNRRQRHAAAMVGHIVLGVAGAAILTIWGPWVSTILFAGEARATTAMCFWYGVAFFFLSASTPFIRNLLIPAGRQSLVFACTLVSAVVGVGMMLWFGSAGIADGVALAVAATEGLIWAVLLVPAIAEWRRESLTTASD